MRFMNSNKNKLNSKKQLVFFKLIENTTFFGQKKKKKLIENTTLKSFWCKN